jgi:hypothetical protein
VDTSENMDRFMNNKLWNISAAAIQSLDDCPAWLKQLTHLSFEEAMQLPTLDVALVGNDVRPSIEERLVKDDYMDFLREQIKLEPRGPEWGEILKARLIALQPFLNKNVIRATFQRKPASLTIRINPDTGGIIQVELN